MDPPSLRKKHVAKDKKKDKQFVYSNKHVRMMEAKKTKRVCKGI